MSALKEHFARGFKSDIESLRWIVRSNCAFVNYKTEAACGAAQRRFHDSLCNGVRMVCRVRKSESAAAETGRPIKAADVHQTELEATLGLGMVTLEESAVSAPADTPKCDSPMNEEDMNEEESISKASQVESSQDIQGCQSNEQLASIDLPSKPLPRYFILKSLTLEDLEASVRNGVWATQPHNESALAEAFGSGGEVYLIFSANKSGEYFGFAQMGSAPGPVQDSAAASTPSDGAAVKKMFTPATEYAPSGYIVDDSARGTLFWEAAIVPHEVLRPTEDDASSLASTENKTEGAQFKLEWKSTRRLPFYLTRGLRNSWNANREVKVARDGTELETRLGERLVQLLR